MSPPWTQVWAPESLHFGWLASVRKIERSEGCGSITYTDPRQCRVSRVKMRSVRVCADRKVHTEGRSERGKLGAQYATLSPTSAQGVPDKSAVLDT